MTQGREENGKRIKGAVMGGLQLWAAGAQAPWGFSGRSCGRIAELSPCEDKAAGALAHQLLSVLGTDSQPVQPATHLGAEAGSQLTCRSPLKGASGAGPGVNGPRPLFTLTRPDLDHESAVVSDGTLWECMSPPVWTPRRALLRAPRILFLAWMGGPRHVCSTSRQRLLRAR